MKEKKFKFLHNIYSQKTQNWTEGHRTYVRPKLNVQEALIKLANFTILCKNETKDITTNKAS
jgi:hypothetical protein